MNGVQRWNPNPQSKAVILHKTTVLWDISPISSATFYFRQEWLAFLLCLLASNAWFVYSFWYKPANNRRLQAIPLSSCPDALPTSCWISCAEDRACYRVEPRTGWNKSNRKGLGGLTGMWWGWHWCGVGGSLTQTCWRGWRCSQRDNSAASSHRPHRPAPNLSGCLSSSAKKTHGTHVTLPLLCHHWESH